MREILTALGVLVIVALLGAMIGPHFVDWGRHKPLIEQHLSELAGHPVRIDGPIAVTLLPTPSLSLDQVRVGEMDSEGKPLLTAERIQGALAPMALLRGDIHVTEASIDGPVLTIGPEGIRLPRGMAASGFGTPESVSIERLLLRDGTAVVRRPGKEALSFSAIGGEVEATSLLGPAKGNVSFVFEDNRRQVRFSIGRVDRGSARIKALLEDTQAAVRIDLDGVASFSPSAGKLFDGTVSLTANTALGSEDKVQLPVSASGKLKVADGIARLDEVLLSIGPEPQPAQFSGAGWVEIAARPVYALTLAARSYDFDRPGPDGKPRLAVPVELIRRAMELAPSPGKPLDLEGKIDVSLGALIMGGQTVMAPRLVVRQYPTGAQVESFFAELPGQSRLDFARDSGSDSGLISGRMGFESRDPERLHGWFNGIPRVVTAHAALKATARLSSLKDGVRIERLDMDRGATRLSGSGHYVLAMPGVRPAPHLVLKLTSPRFEVADIPSFVVGDKAEVKPDLDFSVDIEAEKLVLDGNETGRLVFRARRDGAITSIDRVAITDFGGASLIASGALGGGARRVTLKLDAARGEAIAALAEQVFPGAFTAGLRKRAGLLVPALVVASLANDVNDESYTLSAEGRMAGTDVKAAGTVIARADIAIDLGVSAQNADGARLAQQIGAGRSGPASALPGMLDLKVKGNPRAAMDVEVKAGLAGLAAGVSGQIRLFQPFSPFEGVISARAGDVQPLLQAFGIEGIAPAGGNARLDARIASTLNQLTLMEMKAEVAGSPMTGEVSFKLNENGKVAGQIRTPSFDLRPLIGRVLGPVKAFRDGRGWPTEAFGKPLASPFTGDLWVETGTAQLDETLRLTDARFVLRFDEGAASLEYASGVLNGLRLSGEAFLKRAGATAYLSTRLKLDETDLGKVWPQGLSGRARGEAQASGSGTSIAKIVQSLAGSGTANIAGAAIPAFAPQALARLVATPPEQIGAIDTANVTRRLEGELQRGPMPLGDVGLQLVVIDGVARFSPLGRSLGGSKHEFSGQYDLGALLGDMRALTSLIDLPSTWKGASPQFSTQWRGPTEAMKRALSVDVLVNGYLAWALQREIEKAEVQDQDMRERAFFNRRYKAAQWMKLRAEEIAIFEKQAAEEAARAEKARIAEEERLRLAEDMLKRQNQSPGVPPASEAAPPRPPAVIPAPPISLTPPAARP